MDSLRKARVAIVREVLRGVALALAGVLQLAVGRARLVW